MCEQRTGNVKRRFELWFEATVTTSAAKTLVKVL
jgi:hypothetical protein